VKTTKFSSPRYIGDPINIVKIFNDKCADELFLLDIDASKNKTGPNFGLLQDIVSEAFMPIAYGGGVRSVEDAVRLFRMGIEKISINTLALDSLDHVSRLADRFGNQCVIGSVDVKRSLLSKRKVYSHCGRSIKEQDPVTWASELVRAGAGEILLTSVDRDGTMEGYDLTLLETFKGRLAVPLTVVGGARSIDDMQSALRSCRLSGLGVGSFFIYQGPHRAVLVSYLKEHELRSLRKAASA